jgi:arginyl-tRNA synthetase
MTNLLDQLTQIVDSIDSTGFSVLPVSRPSVRGDARILYYSRDPSRASKVVAASRALAEEPDVAATSRRATSLLVRFTDDRISRLGAALEAGDSSVLDACDLMAGQSAVVNFCDANPTKALHIGHLRNVALGNALASTLEAAGARVTRQSQVSDYCRSMGEALAGYLMRPQGTTPEHVGLKSDHFVGECYVSYARTVTDRPESDDPVLRQEGATHHDMAEDVLDKWVAGDPHTITAWEKLREWALTGHRATLARLGIEFDRFIYESEFVDVIASIVENGVAKGILTRTQAGAVVYETGDEDYPLLLLARADGFPTQHLRTMALWQTVGATLKDVRSIELVGDEWRSYVRHHKKLMERIEPLGDRRHPTHNLMYGMVRLEGHAVKSRDGAPPLVDEMLDQMIASDDIALLVREGDGPIDATRLVVLLALGCFLVHPKRKPIDRSRKNMFGLGRGLEWSIARALVDAWSSRFDGLPDPAPDDLDYRALVLRSQAHRQLVAAAARRHDVRDLARFHGHLSEEYLAMPPSGRCARVMRTILASGLDALGLQRAPSASFAGSAR